MTILDAMKDEMGVLNAKIQDCMNKSSPFIQQAGQPIEDRFIISELEGSELRGLSIPDGVIPILSDIEKDKRGMVFIQLSAKFSMRDLASYDFDENYAKAYEDSLNNNHKWIHVQPEALGFEDPLELSIGMEEESLIRTCQDVGIVFQERSYHFEYKEADKRVVIAQGLENTIKRLQDDPECANLLKKKLLDFFNNQKNGFMGILKTMTE